MKKIIMMLAMAAMTTIAAYAESPKVLTLSIVQTKLKNDCEQQVKSKLRFAKGVKKVKFMREQKLIVINYDADVTTKEAIVADLKKIKVFVKVQSDKDAPKPKVDAETGASQKAN